MRVLFLDMDGVLNDAAFYEYAKAHPSIAKDRVKRTITGHINPVNVYNLIHILKELPDIRIVISSTWRKFFTLDEIKYMLGKVGVPREKIIGVTDDVPRDWHEGTGWQCVQRGDLCLKWAKENNVTEFVCVDDDSDFDTCKDRLVQTNYKNGLTRTKAEEILKLFNATNKISSDFSRDPYSTEGNPD